MNRRVIVIVLYVLGAVAVGTGLFEIIGGPPAAPGGGPTTASVDSEYRFVHVLWVAVGLILWWSLREAAERAVVTRVVLVVTAAGGLGRLISVVVVGWPHPVFIGAMVLELVVLPLVIWWHAHVFPVASRRQGGRGSPSQGGGYSQDAV